VHLPTGRWQLVVQLSGFTAPCEANAPSVEAKVGPIELEIR
jgi:hypothetical protein